MQTNKYNTKRCRLIVIITHVYVYTGLCPIDIFAQPLRKATYRYGNCYWNPSEYRAAEEQY